MYTYAFMLLYRWRQDLAALGAHPPLRDWEGHSFETHSNTAFARS